MANKVDLTSTVEYHSMINKLGDTISQVLIHNKEDAHSNTLAREALCFIVSAYSNNFFTGYIQQQATCSYIIIMNVNFQRFPLVTSLSPGYMQIDTKILCLKILGYTPGQHTDILDNKMCEEDRVVNKEKRCFKAQFFPNMKQE